jgi:hypothetical protein
MTAPSITPLSAAPPYPLVIPFPRLTVGVRRATGTVEDLRRLCPVQQRPRDTAVVLLEQVDLALLAAERRARVEVLRGGGGEEPRVLAEGHRVPVHRVREVHVVVGAALGEPDVAEPRVEERREVQLPAAVRARVGDAQRRRGLRGEPRAGRTLVHVHHAGERVKGRDVGAAREVRGGVRGDREGGALRGRVGRKGVGAES